MTMSPCASVQKPLRQAARHTGGGKADRHDKAQFAIMGNRHHQRQHTGPVAPAMGIAGLDDIAPDGVLSEHDFGNAIDIMAFEFENGEPLIVEPRQDQHDRDEGFQRAMRGTACLFFATVLGPGTDMMHENHLHLDIKQRGGDWRLCQ